MSFESQEQLAVYFEKECINSLGMHHQFFDFVADQMNKEQIYGMSADVAY
ncbi:hypothetical protein [Moraxella catarrhalis]|nr:hypothetical protein [Moraxella catarrhalis]